MEASSKRAKTSIIIATFYTAPATWQSHSLSPCIVFHCCRILAMKIMVMDEKSEVQSSERTGPRYITNERLGQNSPTL